MNFLIRLLLATLAVLASAYLLPGVAVQDFLTALIVALVLAVLNTFLRPVLVVLSLPLTVLTLGLFLFVINAVLILLTAHFIEGFAVDGFWWALLLSIILSLLVAVLESIFGKSMGRFRW